LQTGQARKAPLIAGDRLTIYYRLYACAVAATVAREQAKDFYAVQMSLLRTSGHWSHF